MTSGLSDNSKNKSDRLDSISDGYSETEISVATELFNEKYDELIIIARRLRRRRKPSETLNTTALVHEAFLRLRPDGRFADESHFLSSASLAMRHTLVDHARKGGRFSTPDAIGDEIASFSDEHQMSNQLEAEDILAVRQGLEFIAAHDPRLVKVVDCRYFVGLTLEETAIILDMNEKTVRRDWVKARALLRQYLATGQTTRMNNSDF